LRKGLPVLAVTGQRQGHGGRGRLAVLFRVRLRFKNVAKIERNVREELERVNMRVGKMSQ
jgi:hypothetical protein